VIHDYFILASFLALAVLLLSSASFIKARKAIPAQKKETKESLIYRRKARIWRQVSFIFITILLGTRLVIILLAPSELLFNGFISSGYAFFLILTALLCLFWLTILYFRYLQKYFKPEAIEQFQEKLTRLQLGLVLGDMLLVGYYFFSGYSELLKPAAATLNAFKFQSAEPYLYLIIFVLVTMAVLTILYFLFIYMRSLRFLYHYMVVCLFLWLLSMFAAFNGTLVVMGWFESLQLSLMLLSWKYGFIGWIFLLFAGISLFTLFTTVIILIIRQNFLDASRIRLVILPVIKTGFLAITGFALLTILPILFNAW
jgi:hypothetical protein